MKNKIILLGLLFTQITFAQYTEVINSNRPGNANSPYSIGTKVYQIETGLFYQTITDFITENYKANRYELYNSNIIGTDITIRTGYFLEKLEFILDINVQNESRNYTFPIEYSESVLGLNTLTVGAKYLVYTPKYSDRSGEIRSWNTRHGFDKKRFIPAVGVYAGLNTNFLHDLYKNPDGLSPKIAIFTQNDFSDKFIVLTNLIMDKAFTDQAENSYIITATYSLSDKFSAFGEHQGVFRKVLPNDLQFAIGSAYLLSKDMQVDFSVRAIIDQNDNNSFLIGGGFSWRLDRHRDEIIGADNNEVQAKQKRSLISTLTFGLISGKKTSQSSSNSKRKIKSQTSTAKKRDLKAPPNKNLEKAKKKNRKNREKAEEKSEKAAKKRDKKFSKKK